MGNTGRAPDCLYIYICIIHLSLYAYTYMTIMPSLRNYLAQVIYLVQSCFLMELGWIESALSLYSAYTLGASITGGASGAAGQAGPSGLVIVLWGALFTVGTLLAVIVILNLSCCCGLLGFALGRASSTRQPTSVPAAAAETAALAGEATAVVAQRAAAAARRRLGGYTRLDGAVNAREPTVVS